MSISRLSACLVCRWFHAELSDEAEGKLLRSKSNGPGSFLVKVSGSKRKHYILAVLLEEGMKYLTIIANKKRLVCPSLSCEPFDTLCDLVDYFKKHEIRVNNKVWGTLSKPFESEPEDNWYFGQLARRHVERILNKNGSGSYLIAVRNNNEDGYDLSVHFNGEALHFGIIAEDDCFRMLDTGRTFKTLSEFVEYYTFNDIVVNESTNYNKLRYPCAKEPDNVMSCESFSEVENEFVCSKRTRPGTFLITRHNTHSGSPDVQRDRHSCDGTTSDIYELVVYFENRPTRFPFRHERNGFMFTATNMFFYSWYELVDFYHSNEIKVGDKVWGKLSQPFRKDPKEEWYFGPLKREDERELLMSEKYGPGSFLIRDCISDPDHYTLA
ncbi:uncharacterized protein, partial [Littorina saxatilis]|uniref:uncharacterized protein n=1 Tax=Littorina saxatilis TaxID=31220 RepID=UPI0038B51CB7